MREIIFIICGYLLGSILFADVASRLLGCGDVTADSPDQNPGASNAFENGGFLCGVLTLCGDIAKGFLPVWLYLSTPGAQQNHVLFALVLAAPVIGHIFPAYTHFRGGKGISTSFGCLLGLLPQLAPVAVLACCFIFFSCIVRVSPHYHRTLVTYLCAALGIALFSGSITVTVGFFVITVAVEYRLLTSREEKESCKVEFLWMH